MQRAQAIFLAMMFGAMSSECFVHAQPISDEQHAPAETASEAKSAVAAPSSPPVAAPAIVKPPAVKPIQSREALIESNLAQGLRTFNLEGWNSKPLEIYPRHVDKNSPENAEPPSANQLFGLEPNTYDILAEFGIRRCYKKTYQRGQRFVQVAVYFFATPEGAYGAYNFMRQGAATIVVRGAGSSEDDLSISFWKGQSFVRLAQTSEDDEESKEALRSIAKVVDEKIPPTSLPPLVLNQLPVIDRVSGSEKLIMGPYSGRRFFPAPFVNSLSLERARGAVTADYRFHLPPERLKLLVIDYGNTSLASSVYESYRNELDAEHDAKDVDTASSPTSIAKVGNSFLLVQLRGARVFVIMNARKRVSPLMLARQIP